MKNYTYEIFNDGYDISVDGVLIIKQREPYAHVFKKDGTYEENAILQIEDLKRQDEESELPSEEEKLRADVDYIAVMEDLELPSYDKEGE